MTQKLFTVEQAASVIGLSAWTIRAWIAQGRLRSLKLGKRRMVPAEEVERVTSEGLREQAGGRAASQK